jgi:FkbM family methyltransferase
MEACLPKVVADLWGGLKVNVLRTFGTLRRWVIGPYSVALLSRTENGLLLAPTGDLMVGRRLSFNGCYDSELLEFFLQRCDATSEVLFVGAHVGALAVPVSRRVRKVVAVEANPTTLELLRMNVVLNGLQNMDVYGFAAGDKNSEVNFLASRLNSGGSGLEMGEWRSWAYAYDKPEKISVQLKRLDDAFADAGFDLIVMDIEGAEALALRGMGNLLMRSRGLLVEVFENHLRRVAKVSNEEFLSLVAPFFDEAVILPEKPRKGEPISGTPYPRSAFAAMMSECCSRGTANVMFSKGRTQT